MRKSVGIGAGVLAIGLLMSGMSAAIEVQGHRGARGYKPEDTLPAFEHALKAGVDVLELDTCVTKDQRLIISHDQTPNPVICKWDDGREVDPNVPLFSMTLAEIKKLDCGSLKNPRFPEQQPVPGTRMPALEELFDLVLQSKEPAAKNVKFNIETKMVPSGDGVINPDPVAFVKLLLGVVKKYHFEKRVMIQSFDHRSLAVVKELEPSIPIVPLVSDNLPDLVALTQNLKASHVSPDFAWITEEVVRDLHKVKVQVIPWTLNDEADFERAVRIGVDGIITDYPDKLIAFLKKKSLRK